MNRNFARELIARNISTNGEEFTFVRNGRNRHGEPDGTTTTVVTVKGLFHQSRGYITKDVSDGTVSREKPQPRIMCLADTDVKKVQHGDTLEYLGRKYTVTGVDNVNEYGIACDISLEVFDDGL